MPHEHDPSVYAAPVYLVATVLEAMILCRMRARRRRARLLLVFGGPGEAKG